MTLSRKAFAESPSLFVLTIYPPQKRTEKKKKLLPKKKIKKIKSPEPLFICSDNTVKVNWFFNWEYEEKRKIISFKDYQKDIEIAAKNLARKLGFDWRDLAFGEGFFIFEGIKRKWNPEKSNFKSWFYSVLKRRMLDRMQKTDWRQPGVRRGRGKYFKANICGGVGIDMEKYFYRTDLN